MAEGAGTTNGAPETTNGAPGTPNGAPAPILNLKQKELIRGTWALVEPNMQGAGLVLFNKLFEIAPDLQQLFSFSDEELDDDHPGLKKHAIQVMEKIGDAIDLMDEEDKLQEALLELGIVHHMSDVNVGSFAPVGEALIYALEIGLKDKFTAEVKEAWLALYGVVQFCMTLGMNEGLDAHV